MIRPASPAIGADAATATGGPDPDAPHEEPSLGYMPALDGVRAFAVLGVMAYHGGIPWLPAGFLGVDTFFVLSGFLITSLLLSEWQRLRTIRLGAFWARRARRLLPALLLVVVFVVLYAAWAVPAGTYPGLRLDALATLFYVANWHFILVGSNYFAQAAQPSLLTHTWSLAVEEQFYLVWPLVVLGVLRWTRRLPVLLAVCAAGALASAVEMALLYRHGAGLTRLYYGTDTHGQCLLVGAALAVVLAMVAARRRAAGGTGPGWVARGSRVPAVLLAAGVAGVVATGLLWWRAGNDGPFLWEGGFLLAALATAAVLACVACLPRSPLATALSVRPLRYLGRISYGMYLWHFPLFQVVDGQRTGLTGYALFGARCAATVAVASVSFYLVERPIRQRRLLRQWRAWLATPAAVGGVLAVVVLATTGAGVVGAAGPAPSAVPTVPPTTTPPATTTPPSGSTGAATTAVLMVGDSTATTLGIALSTHEIPYKASIYNQGTLGCGVAEITQALTKGTVITVPPDCNPASPAAQQWPALWAGLLARFHPQVVAVLAGRWEVSTVEWDGRWTDILHPAFAGYVEQQLRLAVQVASAGGAHVDLLTAPCYDAGEQPDGAPWPADSPARLAAYNAAVRRAAAAFPGTASVVDLDRLVCPGGAFEPTIDGVTVRAPDGVHFPYYSAAASLTPDPDTVTQVEAFGAWIAPRLWPEILGGR